MSDATFGPRVSSESFRSFEEGVEGRKAAAARIRDQAETILSLTVEQWLRPDLHEWGLNFSGYATAVATWQSLVSDVVNAPLDYMGVFMLRKIHGLFEYIIGALAAVKGISPHDLREAGGNVSRLREKVDEAMARAAQRIDNEIPAILAYVAAAECGARIPSNIEAVAERATSILNDAQQNANAIAALVTPAREATQKLGVAQHAEHFDLEASAHSAEARRWLKNTLAAAAGTVGLAAVFLSLALAGIPQGLSGQQLAQVLVAKVLLVSIMISATIWAGRIYRANEHNGVVNRHRRNALSSFETFVKAAGSDTDTKNAVLLQATKAIFAPQATGYNDSAPDGAIGSTQLIELIKTMPKGG